MPWLTRTNIVGMLCSCVVHGALLGGLWLASMHPPERLSGSRPASPPLIVELIPLDQLGDTKNEERLPDTVPLQRTLTTEQGRATPSDRPKPPLELVAASGLPAKAETIAAAPASSAPPSGASRSAELSDYQRRLYEIVARNCRYPSDAKRLRLSGVTKLAFRLDRRGEVLESWIEESSGSTLLDDAALEALERAAPLPPIPAVLPGRMDFVIEIDSSLIQQQFAGR